MSYVFIRTPYGVYPVHRNWLDMSGIRWPRPA